SASTAYQVRLHFAEIVYTAAGQRLFNVALNGTPVLTGFDIFAAAGAANRAVVRAFTTPTTSTGQMTIALTAGAAGQPAIAGIEVVEVFQIDAGGPNVAPFQADAFFSGGTTQST